jgi:hypothetical protein
MGSDTATVSFEYSSASRGVRAGLTFPTPRLAWLRHHGRIGLGGTGEAAVESCGAYFRVERHETFVVVST